LKRWAPWLPIMVLLGGISACSGRPEWVKPGASADTVQGDLGECRALADSAVARDAAIDNDILVTRGGDWQRTGTLGAKKSTFAMQDRGRARDIIETCMAAKGYSPRT
jgi:hypothetical protein